VLLMFPSLLSHELAAAHQADLRREAFLAGGRRRHRPAVRPALTAAVQRVAAAFAGLRPAAAPRACVTC
jgi:hypothetical protein